jgi:VanZ family protein
MLIRAKLYGVSCCLVLAGTVAACLWPFHAPGNEVAWIIGGNGVRFGHYGTIVSRGLIKPLNGVERRGWTLEIWLQPARASESHTILAFYVAGRPGGFSLHQSLTDLLVERGPWRRQRRALAGRFYVDNVFRNRALTFLTLVSTHRGTEVYVNGALRRSVPAFVMNRRDFSGRLIVANSPVANDSWRGDLRGLALYNASLAANEVNQHFEQWRQSGRARVIGLEYPVLLYPFDERSGNAVHNQIASGADLYIPKRYMELRHTLLERFWDEYYPGWNYWKDIMVNIAGFVPLGFFFYAYLSLVWRLGRPGLATIILGGLVSLTIEILQAYLPTRDSGMTDIVTNTLGTAAGVGLWRCTSVVGERFRNSRFTLLRFIAGFLTRDELYARI